jgi:ABC-type polysaccharide/polyol phosphate export permease
MPVFFTIEQVAAKGFYKLYMLNPIATLLVTYQRALLPPPPVAGQGGHNLPPIGIPWDYFALAALSSTLILVLGFYLFEKYQWEMAERL